MNEQKEKAPTVAEAKKQCKNVEELKEEISDAMILAFEDVISQYYNIDAGSTSDESGRIMIVKVRGKNKARFFIKLNFINSTKV